MLTLDTMQTIISVVVGIPVLYLLYVTFRPDPTYTRDHAHDARHDGEL